MSDDEQFCPRCLAGVASDEHHGKCVVGGHAEDGEPARPYVLRSGFVGPLHHGVHVDEAGNFEVMTRGTPRALAAMLRLLADEVESDEPEAAR